MQDFTTINWEVVLQYIIFVLIFVLIGLVTRSLKGKASKEDVDEAVDGVIEELPNNLEPIAQKAKDLGETIMEYLINKGPGIGAGLAFRNPEIQKIFFLSIYALLHFFNYHHEDIAQFLKEKDMQSVLKIKLGGTA